MGKRDKTIQNDNISLIKSESYNFIQFGSSAVYGKMFLVTCISKNLKTKKTANGQTVELWILAISVHI